MISLAARASENFSAWMIVSRRGQRRDVLTSGMDARPG
jgi:hypothetical protein